MRHCFHDVSELCRGLPSGFLPVVSNESFVRIVYMLLATAAYGYVCDHN